MLWRKINDLTGRTPLPVPYAGIFAIDIPTTDTTRTPTRWLIGPYNKLTTLATALRTNAGPRQTLSDLRVRLGLRETDLPPTGDRQARYGESKPGVPPGRGFLNDRKEQLALPAREGRPLDLNRRTDRASNVLTYWQSQTPQSHHIVEYNNLREIGVSAKGEKGEREMDHGQLPAVLLAAEFHQGYFSAFLKQAHGLNEKQLRDRMPGLYRSLYVGQSALFKPLWSISQLILREAGLTVA